MNATDSAFNSDFSAVTSTEAQSLVNMTTSRYRNNITSITTTILDTWSVTADDSDDNHIDNISYNDDSSYDNVLKWHGAEVIFLFLMLFMGILGNTLVMYIYHFRWTRSNFSIFIKTLASLDLINASITIPIFIVITLDDDHVNFDGLCQGASFVAIMTAMASGVILVVIAFDRNRKICQPLKSEISFRLTRKLSLLALLIGAIMAIPSIFVYGRKDLHFSDNGVHLNITQCFFTDEMNGTPLFWFFMVTLGLTFSGVMTTLAYLYVSMYRALKVHLARRESLGSARRPSVGSVKACHFRSQKTSAKIFFLVTVAFFSSYFPFFIAISVFLIDRKEHVLSPAMKAVVDIAKLSPLMSNAINPFIYSASSRRFRMEVFDVFRCTALKRTPSERARVKVHIRTHTSSTID